MQKLLISVAIFCILFANLASSLDKSQCKCRIKAGKRIVGGRISESTDYPWMVSLSNYPQLPKLVRRFMPETFKLFMHSCGGILINEVSFCDL